MTITAILILTVAALLLFSKKQTPREEPSSRPTREDYVREQQLAIAKTNLMVEQEKAKVLAKKQTIANAKLQFDIMMSEFDMEHLRVTLEDLNESLERAENEALKYRHAGDERREDKAMNTIRVRRNQIHAAQRNLAKAEFARRIADYQLNG